MQTGWNVRFLAEPTILDGKPVAPIEATPSAGGVMKHQRMYNMQGSIVNLDTAVPNPLRQEDFLQRLPYLAHGPARSVHLEEFDKQATRRGEQKDGIDRKVSC